MSVSPLAYTPPSLLTSHTSPEQGAFGDWAAEVGRGVYVRKVLEDRTRLRSAHPLGFGKRLGRCRGWGCRCSDESGSGYHARRCDANPSHGPTLTHGSSSLGKPRPCLRGQSRDRTLESPSHVPPYRHFADLRHLLSGCLGSALRTAFDSAAKRTVCDRGGQKRRSRSDTGRMALRHPVPKAVLARIGAITVSFAFLESTIQSLAGSLLQEHQRIGQIITAELSFSKLRALVMSLYQERHGQDADFEGLKNLMTRARQVEDTRNQITHSVWSAGDSAETVTSHQDHGKGPATLLTAQRRASTPTPPALCARLRLHRERRDLGLRLCRPQHRDAEWGFDSCPGCCRGCRALPLAHGRLRPLVKAERLRDQPGLSGIQTTGSGFPVYVWPGTV